MQSTATILQETQGFSDDRGPEAVRAFDRKTGMHLVRVLPGATYSTGAADEIVVTILGSCVAACVRNPLNGFGGMNHFMLPENDSCDWNGVSSALRYGNYAMEALINTVLKSGCGRRDLEIKLFGGANLNRSPTLVGTKNSEFARQYLEREGMKVAVEDLGGSRGRRILYSPQTGRVQRLLLKPTVEKSVVNAERSYGNQLRHAPAEDDIELFG